MSYVIPHHDGGVYVRRRLAVNWRWRTAHLAALLPLAGGCVAAPGGYPSYPVAIVYGVEPASALQGGYSPGLMTQDFASIHKLGFNTVFIRHAGDEDRPGIVQAAAGSELAAALPNRDVLYYVRTGRLPAGCRTVEDLVRTAWSSNKSEAAIPVLGEVSDEPTAERVARLAAAAQPPTMALLTGDRVAAGALDSQVTWLARPARLGGDGKSGHPLLLECVEQRDDSGDLLTARWLGSYHAGLAAGLTGGLVVDRFRVMPGQWTGLAEGTDPPAADRATAIRRIVSRALLWGPKLQRLKPEPVAALEQVSGQLDLVLFSGAKRRFLMVFNVSPTRFNHSEVVLSADLGPGPVKRAVLVPSEAHILGGEVVHVRGGRLKLPVELAPGDAALWELF